MTPEPNRLFFALWPDEATRAACAEAARKLRARMQAGGRMISPSGYHLTLLFLGDAVPPRDEAAALAAAAGVRAAPLKLSLEQGGSFGHRKIPWWLGPRETPADLLALHAQLRTAMRGAQVSYDRMHLAPHVTVLRDARKTLPPTPIAPIAWAAAEFVLLRSPLQAQPAQYQFVGRWPLRAELSKATGSAQLDLWENSAP